MKGVLRFSQTPPLPSRARRKVLTGWSQVLALYCVPGHLEIIQLKFCIRFGYQRSRPPLDYRQDLTAARHEVLNY